MAHAVAVFPRANVGLGSLGLGLLQTVVVLDLVSEALDLLLVGADRGVVRAVHEIRGSSIEQRAGFVVEIPGCIGDGVEVFAADRAIFEGIAEARDFVDGAGSVGVAVSLGTADIAGASERFTSVGAVTIRLVGGL